MRVLHAYKIYMPDVYGGIPHVIATLSKLSAAGVETLILVARGFGRGRVYDSHGAVVRATTSFGTLASTPMAPTYPLAFAKHNGKFDLVVCHAPFPLADLGLLFRPRARTPLIVHWHADIIGRPALARLISPLIKRTLRLADRIVVSHEVMTDCPFLKPHAEKCIAVPYGCDVTAWASLDARQQQRVEELRLKYPRLVVAIGRLVPYKGYDVFLNALAKTDAQAVIVGAGPLLAELKDLAKQLQIEDRVLFAGSQSVDNIKCYLHAARVFALPSTTKAEAFGIVQLEAMAAGRPIVNTSLATAVPHIARDSQEALTVPPGDAAALAHALRTLLDDPSLADRLGGNALQRVRAVYEEADFIQKMHDIYIDVVQEKTKRRTEAV